MSWVFLALLSPLVFAIVNFLDKFIVENLIPDVRAMAVFGGIIGGFYGIVLWVVSGFPVIPAGDALLLLSSGMLTMLGAPVYFKVVAIEETSRLIVLAQCTPIFVLIFSLIFFRDSLSPEQLLGFILILMAAVGISLVQQPHAATEPKKGFQLSQSFWLMLIVTFFVAWSFLLGGNIRGEYPAIEIVVYVLLGLGLGSLGLYLFVGDIRRAFSMTTRTASSRALLIIGASESVFVLARLLAALAVADPKAATSIVSVLGSVGVFYGIGIGWLLTILIPAIYREDISRSGLTRKLALSMVMFAGIILVN